MRKTMLLMTVGALVVLSSVPATAKRVVNESYKEYQIQANMGSDNSEGGAWAIDGENGSALGINYSANYECDEGSDPDDLLWESAHGEANLEEFEVTPTKGKTKFTYGFATGSFVYGSYDWEECDGDQFSIDLGPAGPAGPPGERLTIEAFATDGRLVKTSGSNSWHIPSETNNHRSDKGLMRLAVAGVVIPAAVPDGSGGYVPAVDWHGEGSIGQHSWSEHTNE
jgi:hypothetical protein